MSKLSPMDGQEHPVPQHWRAWFHDIADQFRAGNFQLRDCSIAIVAPNSARDAKFFAQSVAAYGSPLTPLSDETWRYARCRWMDGYWRIVVDLTTSDESVSDLALHAELTEDEGTLKIVSLHVP
ncbi:hypothetical protein [Alteriqipengyuania sp.]|uniref:DUF7668 domain-containing protein n=1 Tax=Alteriqipengyuania sp. TaxID=2800692 RepID=UPI0035127D2C